MRFRYSSIFISAAIFVLANTAHASCGSAFCMVNTNWTLQGMGAEPGFRLDFRYEYIDQDRLQSGRDKVSAGEIPREHDEIRTINRNYLATLDYTANDRWGVAVTIPFADRFHAHDEHDPDTGDVEREEWNFTRLGDVRVLGRYQLRGEDAAASKLSFYGLNFGLKLPTGSRTVVNEDGERAERSLQPGTGTTDLLLGAYYSAILGQLNSSWFVQALWDAPLDSREDYRPGQRVSVDLGYRYEATDRIGLIVQLNALYRGRDSGAQAEREDSGGEFLFISPGISVALTKGWQVYGFFQQPLYQDVNGVQLVAKWSAVFGVAAAF